MTGTSVPNSQGRFATAVNVTVQAAPPSESRCLEVMVGPLLNVTCLWERSISLKQSSTLVSTAWRTD